MKKSYRTGQIFRRARRFLLRAGKVPSEFKRHRGFVSARIGNLLCAGWYEAYASGVRLVSGPVAAWGRRLQGLPPRFEALFLLYRLRNREAHGMMCRSLS